MRRNDPSISRRRLGGGVLRWRSWAPALAVAVLVTAAVLTSLAAPLAGHRELSGREWQQLAANPAAYVGEQITVRGVVTRPGAGTQRDVVEARVDGLDRSDPTDIITPAELRGADPTLQAGDTFRADVMVQAPDGGGLVLRVDRLRVLEHAR
jgi:hypothetical protein